MDETEKELFRQLKSAVFKASVLIRELQKYISRREINVKDLKLIKDGWLRHNIYFWYKGRMKKQKEPRKN